MVAPAHWHIEREADQTASTYRFGGEPSIDRMALLGVVEPALSSTRSAATSGTDIPPPTHSVGIVRVSHHGTSVLARTLSRSRYNASRFTGRAHCAKPFLDESLQFAGAAFRIAPRQRAQRHMRLTYCF